MYGSIKQHMIGRDIWIVHMEVEGSNHSQSIVLLWYLPGIRNMA